MRKEMVESVVAGLVHDPEANVVDVGCGNGRYAVFFPNYRGYDQSASMLAFAPTSCTQRDIWQGAPYDDVPDYVLSIDTSRHYEDPVDLLKTVMQKWPAHKYLFSILYGPEHTTGSNITVLSQTEMEQALAEMGEVTDEWDENLGDWHVRYAVIAPR